MFNVTEITTTKVNGIWVARCGTAMATGRSKASAIERVSQSVQRHLMKLEQREMINAMRAEFQARRAA